MERTAYLVADFRTTSGVPVFSGVGIYSAPAGELTIEIGKMIGFDVISTTGKDFEDAIRNLIALLKLSPIYGWALAALPDRYAEYG